MNRTVIKHSYLRYSKEVVAKAQAHVRYLAFRPGKDKCNRTFFSADEENISPSNVVDQIKSVHYRGVLIHKLILSPGNDEVDTKEYTKHLMEAISKRKGLKLDYKAVVHDNTNHKHAHVIIFGRDLNGQRVRLTKEDHDYLRQEGDSFLDKNIVAPEPWLEPHDKRNHAISKLAKFFGERVAGSLLRIFRNKDATLLTKSQFIADETSLGDLPTSHDRLKAWVKQKAKRIRSKNWHNRPIVINQSSAVIHEYGPNTSLELLVELKDQCRDGFYRDQVSRLEVRKLDTWIDNWKQWEARTKVIENMHYAKALRITSIAVAIDADTTNHYTKESSLQDLQSLKEQTDTGVLALKPQEQKALEIWVKDKKGREPILVDMGEEYEPMLYRHDDPIDSLRLLARTAKTALEPDDYKKLWYWIYQRERDEEKEREQYIPVKITAPYAELEYTKDDSKEHLAMLLDGYKHKAKWALENMKEKDVKKVKEWLTKDEPEI